MGNRSCLADISEFQNRGENNRDIFHYTSHVATAIRRRLRKRICKSHDRSSFERIQHFKKAKSEVTFYNLFMRQYKKKIHRYND